MTLTKKHIKMKNWERNVMLLSFLSGNSNKTPIVSANSSSVMVSSSATSSSAANSGSGSSSGITAGSSGVPVQYIMGQAGVPFYQQPLYSFEELQMLQQRMPHMVSI